MNDYLIKFPTLAVFTKAVAVAMEDELEVDSIHLSSAEESFIAYGYSEKMGPIDTAYQLVDNRTEANDPDSSDIDAS